MTITIKNGNVVIAEMSREEFALVRSWNMTRWNARDASLIGPVSLDLLARLSAVQALPADAEDLRRRLVERRRRLEEERGRDEPVPLVEYPVTKKLFKHQIRGANMALIAFGCEPGNGGGDAR